MVAQMKNIFCCGAPTSLLFLCIKPFDKDSFWSISLVYLQGMMMNILNIVSFSNRTVEFDSKVEQIQIQSRLRYIIEGFKYIKILFSLPVPNYLCFDKLNHFSVTFLARNFVCS